MAEQTVEDLAQWLVDNKGNRDTPEFQQNRVRYKEMRSTMQPAADPYDVKNTLGRYGTGLVGNPVDFAVTGLQNNAVIPIVNKLADYFGFEKVKPMEPVLPKMRSAMSVQELPADASPLRRGLEEAAQILTPAGPAAVTAFARAPSVARGLLSAGGSLVRNAAVPYAGSEVGGAIGEQIGGDTGRFWGSTVGGFGAPAATAGVRAMTAPRPNANAPNIAAAHDRLGVRSTPGSLGDERTKATERGLAGSGPIDLARENAFADTRAGADRFVAERQAIPDATPETANLVSVARQMEAAGLDPSAAVQQIVKNRIGGQSPINVQATLDAMEAARFRGDEGLYNSSVGPRAASLRRMIEQYQAANPGTTANVLPYERFQSWNSGLGRRLTDTELPVSRRDYGDVFQAARGDRLRRAQSRGVRPEEFELAQGLTSGRRAAGDLNEMMRTTIDADKSTGMRQFADRMDTMEATDPTAFARLGGNNQQMLRDLSTTARSLDYPTTTTGLNRATNNGADRIASLVGGGGIGALLAQLLDPSFAAMGGMIAAPAFAKMLRYMRGAALNNPGTVDYLAGRQALPGQAVSMSDLVAAMQAAQMGTQVAR